MPKRRSKSSEPFDLTAELRGVAERLQTWQGRVRPYSAASELEAFGMIQAEAARLQAATAFIRGIKLADDRLSTFAVTQKQKKLITELREMLHHEITRRGQR